MLLLRSTPTHEQPVLRGIRHAHCSGYGRRSRGLGNVGRKRTVHRIDPADDAFAEPGLSSDHVGDLPVSALTGIFLYHAARGRRDAEDVLDSSRIRLLQRAFVFQSGGVLTDTVGCDAVIIVTDVPAANGIMHAIDTVPPPFELQPVNS